jgi:hypothetical protein
MEDEEVLESTMVLFSESQTRKESWRVLMSRRRKIVKALGLANSLRLIPALIRSIRV